VHTNANVKKDLRQLRQWGCSNQKIF